MARNRSHVRSNEIVAACKLHVLNRLSVSEVGINETDKRTAFSAREGHNCLLAPVDMHISVPSGLVGS